MPLLLGILWKAGDLLLWPMVPISGAPPSNGMASQGQKLAAKLPQHSSSRKMGAPNAFKRQVRHVRSISRLPRFYLVDVQSQLLTSLWTLLFLRCLSFIIGWGKSRALYDSVFFCNVQGFNRHKMIKNVTNSLSRLMWLLLIIYLCGSSAWAPFFVGWKWQDETWPDGSNPLSSYPAKFVHTTHCHIMALPHLPSAGADDGKNIKSESQFFEQVRYRA